MGWQSPFRSSPRTAPLAAEVVDNTVDYRTLSVGFGTVGGVLGGTWTRAIGTNEVTDTVQTSASTVAAQAFVANTPKIGQRGDANTRGLVIDPASTNLLQYSSQLESVWVAESGMSVNNAVAPDGTTTAEKLTRVAGGPILTRIYQASAVAFTNSAWLLQGTQGTVTSLGYAGSGSSNFTATASWQRCQRAPVTTSYAYTILYVNANGEAGAAANGDNFVWWGAQAELLKYATELMPTAATTASRAAGYERRSMSSYVSNGQMRLRMLLSPKGTAAAYDTDARLFTVNGGPVACYANIATGTRILTIVHDATTLTFAVPMGWEADKYMEIEIHVGGSQATRVRYRFCPWTSDPTVEANWGRPFDPSGGGSIATIGTISDTGNVDVLSDGTAKTLGATLHLQETFVTTVPAWVLEWTPTDLAEVAAFWRPDGGITHASNVVSAWGDQTTGKALSQGTIGKRPLYVPDYFATGKPALYFDGGDAISIAAFDFPASFEVYFAIKTTSAVRLYVLHDGTTVRRHFYMPGTSANLRSSSAASLISYRSLTASLQSQTAARVIGHRWSVSEHAASVDGVDLATTTPLEDNPAAAVATGALHVFSYLDTSEYTTGRLAGVVVTSSLSAPNRALLLARMTEMMAA